MPGLPLPGGMGGGKRSPLVLLLMLIVLLCGAPLYFFFGGGGDNSTDQPVDEQQPAEISQTEPTARPTQTKVRPTKTPPQPAPAGQIASPAGGSTTWTVLLYQDADDKVLEQDIYIDLNEVERAGKTDQVRVVAQIDRYRGGYEGDGNWTGTRRYLIELDDDLQQVQSEVVDDLGEVNMSEAETLIDFVEWGVENYPADKYVLILSDHGMGWPGGWSDPDPGGRGPSNIPLASVMGNQLYLMELDQALEEIRASTGIEAFELVGMDACLMGQLEVLAALAPHARYAVVSEETEPSLGWAYTSFISALIDNPDMDGAELGRLIVDSYIEEDQRIVDERARLDWVGRGSPMNSLYKAPTANQVSQQLSRGITLTAVDLTQVPDLMEAVNELALRMQQLSQKKIAKARTYAQGYTSIFGSKVPASYIDLGNFISLLKREANDQRATAIADQALQSLDRAVIAEKHGSEKSGSTGISIYFPNSQLYANAAAGAQSYTAIAQRFAEGSLWDEFLAFHYTGQEFEPVDGQAAVPPSNAAVRGPGAAPINISPVRLSNRVASSGSPVLVSADISGENIGYIYFFTGFIDQQARSIFVADQDYLTSGADTQVGGMTYPDWGEGAFTLEFEWEPLMFAISDGEQRVTVALTPENYGASPEDAVYTVDGIYTYADGGEQRSARMYFRDGVLRQVFGFSGQDANGAPREITPSSGDTFTVLETWFDLDADGQVSEQVTQEGGTLTFSDQMFTWQELDAAPGPYVIGFIVTDFDGNAVEAYAQLVVR